MSTAEGPLNAAERDYFLEFADAVARQRIRRLQIALGGVVLLLVVALGFGGVTMWQVASERNSLRARLDRANAELEEMSVQTARMVEGRIPNALPVELDRTILLADSYVRDITFARFVDQQQVAYEYHLVLHNRGNQLLTPAARVLLFDNWGMQIGTGGAPTEELLPGEVRLHTGVVDLVPGTTPVYFLVATEAGALQAG